MLSTLHTTDATETVNRLLDFFPPHQQNQVRLTLAGALRGIVCQRLVPDTTGGRVACLEVLVNTGIADRIVDPATTSEIKDVIAKGGFYGMRTFDQAHLELVTLGAVTIEDAKEASSEPHNLELMLEQVGLTTAGEVQDVSYERDIKPLFGEVDRARMLWAFDVWDYESVKANSEEILRRLDKGDIPFENGWPKEQIDLLRSWITEVPGLPEAPLDRLG